MGRLRPSASSSELGAAVVAVDATIRRWRPAGTWLILVAVAVLDVSVVLLGTR